MASSDQKPGPMPGREDGVTPGQDMTVGTKIIDKGAQLMQSFKPVNNMNQHVCTFAVYSHDMSRIIETHHFVARLNQGFCQCAVYDSDLPSARLIGVEYIISEETFKTLPAEEQKLWHSHAFEIKSGLWINPRLPEIVEKSELQTLAKTFGKFWCTWQVDRGDKLPLGAPALMMSPQSDTVVISDQVKLRNDKYEVSNDKLIFSRGDVSAPDKSVLILADTWNQTGKGFALDIQETDIKTTAPFP